MPEEKPAELPVNEQEVQIQAPSFLDKIKVHKLKILAGALGVLVFAGAVFGAYRLGQRQIQVGPQPTPSKECDEPNVTGVYTCTNGLIKVVYRTLGTGFVLINEKGERISCPVVAYIKEECKNPQCSSENLCRPLNEEAKGERVYCKDPRPEVCTMECITNPPYICGSDGKSYCSTCQACSNPKVEWYVIQDAPCGTK